MRPFSRITTKQFRKDLRRLEKSGFKLAKLEDIIDILVSGENVPSSYRDHELKGAMKGKRACHVAPDWLLVYIKDNEKLILLLLRTGSHRTALGIE